MAPTLDKSNTGTPKKGNGPTCSHKESPYKVNKDFHQANQQLRASSHTGTQPVANEDEAEPQYLHYELLIKWHTESIARGALVCVCSGESDFTQ